MNIAYVSSNTQIPSSTADGVAVLHTCSELIGLGNEVKLHLPGHSNNTNLNTFYGTNHNVHVSWHKSFLLVHFRRPGHHIYVKNLVKKLDVDVLHHRRSIYGIHAFKNPNIKLCVWECHNIGKALGKSETYSYLNYLRSFSHYGVITTTKVSRNKFEELGVPSNKILVARNGVFIERYAQSTSKYLARSRLGLSLDKKIIGYAGSLQPDRGLSTLLHIADRLAEYEIAIVGGGGKILAESRINAPNNVHYLGYIPNSDLPDFLKAVDVLVMPYSLKYKDNKYCSPMKAFDYMASGVPIVASDQSFIREILPSDEYCGYFTPDSPDELHNSIIRFLSSASLSRNVASNAFSLTHKYTWQKRAHMINEFYINLLNNL